jgi:hypothetical protein
MLNETQQKSIYDIYNQMMPKPDDHFQSNFYFSLLKIKILSIIFETTASQANLLMSQLISRASESQRLVVNI